MPSLTPTSTSQQTGLPENDEEEDKDDINELTEDILLSSGIKEDPVDDEKVTEKIEAEARDGSLSAIQEEEGEEEEEPALPSPEAEATKAHLSPIQDANSSPIAAPPIAPIQEARNGPLNLSAMMTAKLNKGLNGGVDLTLSNTVPFLKHSEEVLPPKNEERLEKSTFRLDRRLLKARRSPLFLLLR